MNKGVIIFIVIFVIIIVIGGAGVAAWWFFIRNGGGNSGNGGGQVFALDAYNMYSDKDITPGTDMWGLSGTLEECAAKCDDTADCAAFVHVGNTGMCYGKSSSSMMDNASGGIVSYVRN